MIRIHSTYRILAAVVFTAVFLNVIPANAQWRDCGVPVSTAADPLDRPHAVASGDGGAIVAWTDYGGSDWDIYVQRLDPSGVPLWTTDGVPVCTAVEDQWLGGIVPDGKGGVIVVWTDCRAKPAVNLKVLSPALLDYLDIYAQRIDAAGNTLWTSNGVAVCDAWEEQKSPSILADGAGGAFFAWSDERNDDFGDIYAQHLDSLGTVHVFPNGYPVSAVPSEEQDYPVLVSDGSDGALIVWRDTQAGSSYNLHAQHINTWCLPTWSPWPNGINVTGGGNQWFYEAVSDDAGGMIVAWVQSYCTGGLYVQRVDGSGNLMWGTGGVDLYTGTGTLIWNVEMTKGGNGGAIIVWPDEVQGSWEDVVAQAVDASGSIRWPDGGVVLCDEEYEQREVTVAADGAGGAFVAWQDARGPSYDVYAQHVDSLGSCLWKDDGVAVCSVDDYVQIQPSIVNDDRGGAIVVYEGGLGSAEDLYAARILEGTVIGLGETPSSNRLAQNYPNPFNPTTTIAFELAEPGYVSLRVYDVTGRLVRTLAEGHRAAGPHAVDWDARNNNGLSVASGIYMYRLAAPGFSQTRKMVLLK